MGITFTGEGGLMGMVDADWNGNLDDHTSSTGYIFFFAGGPVAWKSQRQSLPAQSLSEAELVVANAAVNEAVWLRKLLSELQPFAQQKSQSLFLPIQRFPAKIVFLLLHTLISHLHTI